MTTKTDFRQLVLQEGVPAAYRGLKRVLDDPKASATALASAARTMLEAGGMLKAPEQDAEKEPYEMTAGELQAQIARLRREAADRATPVVDIEPRRIAKPKNGVFD